MKKDIPFLSTDPVEAAAQRAWEKSDSAKILSPEILKEINDYIITIIKSYVSEPVVPLSFTEVMICRLQDVLAEPPYCIYKKDGEDQFITVSIWPEWMRLYRNLHGYLHIAAMYAKSIGAREAAFHYLRAKKPLSEIISVGKVFYRALGAENAETLLSELEAGDQELEIAMKYLQLEDFAGQKPKIISMLNGGR